MKATWKLAAVFAVFIVMAITACDDGDGSDDTRSKTDAERPTITVDLAGGAYLPGATVKPLSVTASVSDGGDLSYQWYSRASSVAAGTKIEQAINASFIPTAAAPGTVYYYVEVTNTNNSVDGTKTAVQTSRNAKIVTGWESVENLYHTKSGIAYQFSSRSIVFANNRFVAVGGFIASGGQIAWSVDGVAWNFVENTTFGNSIINGIVYGNNRFIAVGDDGKMASSTNGETWTSVDASAAFGTSNINDIAYGNSRFFAVGDGSKSAYLVDSGSTWTSMNIYVSNLIFGNAASISRIVYGVNRFMAYAYSYDAQCSMVRNNIESDSWQGNPISGYGWTGTATIWDLINADNYIVAVGTGGNVWTLDNGIDWFDKSPTSVLGTSLITKAAYGSGKLFVFSSDKGAWSDDDGATWTEVPYVNMSRMAYGKGRFVAAGGGSGIYYADYP